MASQLHGGNFQIGSWAAAAWVDGMIGLTGIYIFDNGDMKNPASIGNTIYNNTRKYY